MFKKKPNLPPRPKYPSTDQIISDLDEIKNDDPLFKTARNISDRKSRTHNSQDHDDVYEKIEKFFNMHGDLKETIKNLDILNGELREKEIEIGKLSDDLKDQALKALV